MRNRKYIIYFKTTTIILILFLISIVAVDAFFLMKKNYQNFFLRIVELILASSSAITFSFTLSLNLNFKEKNIENHGMITSEGNQTVISGDNNIVNLPIPIDNSIFNNLTASIDELKKENQNEIIRQACKLANEQNVHNAVDKDFIVKYLDEASLISDNEIQEIWAKLLVSKSFGFNNVSKRTLDIVKNLSSNEAKIFEKVALHAHFNGIIEKDHCSNDVPFLEITILQDIGLLKSGDFNYTIFIKPKSQSKSELVLNDTIIIIENLEEVDEKLDYPCYILSEEGKQLANSLKFHMPISEQIIFGNFIKNKASNQLRVHLYKVVDKTNDGKVIYDQGLDLI